ncbi:hypothetical protein C2G38_2229178 [Gigaspora rosea]|uniref:Protein kinase domain-containing protein n=1 Tax=Gigaspora rosea TaxID=44941 RepID=A0A397TYR2_9GLOM|nr:hypothetical protein C2G38_2229178 [Gigaspora rosea]
MYIEESSLNINNNLSTEWTTDFTCQDQINIDSLNIYNNPSTEWSADFTQVYEDQTNNSLPTEWSMELAQDQTTISLPKVYNNLFIEWSTDFSQDQIIRLSTEFTNNIPFMEWNLNFTQTNTSSLNIYNNSIIELSVGITQNNEDQTNHHLSIEWTTCFAQDQTNTNLSNIYNAEILNIMRNKLIICNSNVIKSNLEFFRMNNLQIFEYLAKGGFSKIYKATWVNGPITRWCHKLQRYNRIENHDVVLKILNNSEKMNSDF